MFTEIIGYMTASVALENNREAIGWLGVVMAILAVILGALCIYLYAAGAWTVRSVVEPGDRALGFIWPLFLPVFYAIVLINYTLPPDNFPDLVAPREPGNGIARPQDGGK